MAAEIRQILIDGYPIDVAKVETHTLEAEVTEHPVEKGSVISDHVRLNPIEVTLECLVSDTPLGIIAVDPTRINSQIEIDGESSTTVPTPSEDAYARLRAIRLARQPVTIETSLDRFENMILTRLTIPRSADTSGGLTFEATFREIVIVENLRVTVRVAEPRGNKKADLGAQPPIPLTGKQFQWNHGFPSGRSEQTTPSGVITFRETIVVKPASTTFATTGKPRVLGQTYNYYHLVGNVQLTPNEVRAMKLDLERDEFLANKVSNAKKLKSTLDRVDKLLEENYKPAGATVDPGLYDQLGLGKGF